MLSPSLSIKRGLAFVLRSVPGGLLSDLSSADDVTNVGPRLSVTG